MPTRKTSEAIGNLSREKTAPDAAPRLHQPKTVDSTIDPAVVVNFPRGGAVDANSTAAPSDHFTFQGRKWRIFKLRNDPAASWYFQQQKNGRRKKISLFTPIKATAIAKAKLRLEAAAAGKLAKMDEVLTEKIAVPPATVKLSEYLSAYEATATGKSKLATRRGAVNAFKRILGTLDVPPATLDTVLIEKALRAYARSTAAAVENEPDQARQQVMKRSFNSTLKNAAMIYNSRAEFALEADFTLPDFTRLRTVTQQLLFTKVRKTAEQYNRPTDATMAATLRDWPTLPRNEFMAFGLAAAAGLRRGEIVQADWSWFRTLGGVWWIDASATVKNQSGTIRNRCLDPFFSLMMEQAKREGWTSATGPIITGNHSEFDRNISAFMRCLGWKTQKHLHALRAWAGSLVFDRYGEEAACGFCRHSSLQTTRNFYSYLRDENKLPDEKTKLAGRRVQWANAAAK